PRVDSAKSKTVLLEESASVAPTLSPLRGEGGELRALASNDHSSVRSARTPHPPSLRSGTPARAEGMYLLLSLRPNGRRARRLWCRPACARRGRSHLRCAYGCSRRTRHDRYSRAHWYRECDRACRPCPAKDRARGRPADYRARHDAVTASQRDHVLADFGFAIENVLGRIPIRPFLLV